MASKRGPKPKPTALKILAGVREDRINRAEPRADAALPEPPDHLGDVARDEWARFVPQLHATGVLARIDGAAIALYCTHYERWVEAEDKLREYGLITPTGTGSVKQSPFLQIATAAMKEMSRLLAEFGATPSSRSRVKVPDQVEEEDEISKFLAKA